MISVPFRSLESSLDPTHSGLATLSWLLTERLECMNMQPATWPHKDVQPTDGTEAADLGPLFLPSPGLLSSALLLMLFDVSFS